MKRIFINAIAGTILITTAVNFTTNPSAEAASLSDVQLNNQTVNAFNKGKLISTKKLNAEMLKLVNKERKLKGAPALKVDSSTAVANGTDKRANEVAVLFSHQRPNGQLYSTAFPTSVRQSIKGENVALRSYSPMPAGVTPEKYIAETLYAQWNASSQHHGNMINKKFKKTAFQVKLKYNKEKQRYYYYGVQIFKTK